MLIYGSTDQSLARIHSIENQPMFTAGRAGGKVKTGLHIQGGGTACTRLGLTAMKVFGLENSSWGNQSNSTSKEISEMLT